eukprot:COSAG01_NODE_52438_length_346_cov_2.890688_1_plen_59_part_10
MATHRTCVTSARAPVRAQTFILSAGCRRPPLPCHSRRRRRRRCCCCSLRLAVAVAACGA